MAKGQKRKEAIGEPTQKTVEANQGTKHCGL